MRIDKHPRRTTSADSSRTPCFWRGTSDCHHPVCCHFSYTMEQRFSLRVTPLNPLETLHFFIGLPPGWWQGGGQIDNPFIFIVNAFANRGKNFTCHPPAEFLRAWQLAGQHQRVQAALVDEGRFDQIPILGIRYRQHFKMLVLIINVPFERVRGIRYNPTPSPHPSR